MSRTQPFLIVPGSYTGPVTPVASPFPPAPAVYDFYSKVAQGQRSPLGMHPQTQCLPGGSEIFSDAWFADFYLRNKVTLAQAYAKQELVKKSRFAMTWGGVAIKGGGHFFAAGKESYGGRLWNLADNDRWCNFSSSVRTFGPSLGGGTEVGLIFFLNTKSLYQIEGMEFGNGSKFSVNVPGKQLKMLVTALKGIESLVDAVGFMDEVRETANKISQAIKGKDPMVVYHGLGSAEAEVGWKYGIQGKINIHGVKGKESYLDEF